MPIRCFIILHELFSTFSLKGFMFVVVLFIKIISLIHVMCNFWTVIKMVIIIKITVLKIFFNYVVFVLLNIFALYTLPFKSLGSVNPFFRKIILEFSEEAIN